jgi:tripartite-type tricarboxylate transporter receptor subunit TctC
MALRRREALAGLAGALAVSPAAPWSEARTEQWPAQPIKIVVPYPPGGLTDVAARLIGERLQGAFGQPVIVDNKAGAGTQLGASYVAKQPADGYTLLLATVTTLCIAPALYAKPMIANSDFAGVAMLGNVTLILVARPDLPVANPKELIALLRTKPGGYTYGSPGIGTAHHLLTELMLSHAHLTAVHVPYLGSVKAVSDLTEGRLDFMFVDGTVALPQIAAGKLKPLAVSGAGNWASLPKMPAIAEFSPGLDAQPWLSIAGPANTPLPVLERLNREINKALADTTVAARLRQVGLEPMPLTVAALADFVKRDAGRWAEMVRISGAKAE